MKDRMIICIQCERPFPFSSAEEDRFLANGFDLPKRCPSCRKKRFKMPEADKRDSHRHRKKNHSRRVRNDYDYDEG